MSNQFKFCPKCGSKNIESHANKWLCPECGFDLYNNVAAAVGVLICDKQNNVLMEVRAKNPRKGFLAFPGGFVDMDESVESAAVRECREEIGVEISGVKFLCSYPNTYEYKEITYKTCDVFFTADLPSQYTSIKEYISTLKKQESEVLGFESCKIETVADVEKLPVAFDSAKKTLLKYIEMRDVK